MYTILTDSCSDLNAEVAAKFDHFEVIPLSYTISGETSFQPFDDAQRCSAFYGRDVHNLAGFAGRFCRGV